MAFAVERQKPTRLGGSLEEDIRRNPKARHQRAEPVGLNRLANGSSHRPRSLERYPTYLGLYASKQIE